MIETLEKTQVIQEQKKQRLEREFSWIKDEFNRVSTLSESSFYNVDEYIRRILGCNLI